MIDEEHFLLPHPALIEMTREFNNVGLITATPHDLTPLRVLKDFHLEDSGTSTLEDNKTNTLDTRTMLDKYSTNLFNETQFHGRVLNIQFNGKKKFYEYYVTKSFPSYKIVMSKKAINNGKRVRMYALAHEGTNTLTIHTQTLHTNESGIVEYRVRYHNKPFNIEFNGIKHLKDYYNIKSIPSIPQYLMIKDHQFMVNVKEFIFYS